MQKFTAPPRNIIVNVERYVVATYNQNLLSLAERYVIDVKKRFTCFILVTFLRFLTFFFIFQTFFIFKNVGKGQSGKQINKKHFQ